MSLNDFLQISFYVAVLVLLTPLLGAYMARVYEGRPHPLKRILSPIERLVYKLARLDADKEMDWKQYAKAMLWFNALGFFAVFLFQMVQSYLPLNPQNLPNVQWALSINTAVSFMTNTNWQAYAGETTLSNFSQTFGLSVQNFVSAASGMAVLIALTRGIIRKTASTLGNFWSDLVRSTVYILLPLSVVLAIVLVSQGTVQTFAPAAQVTTLEGQQQTIPLGPAASQIAIKQLGTNGGGFYNANSAHPLENPTPLSNFLEMLALLLIPAALTYTYGTMTGKRKHGWVLFAVMLAVWLAGLGASVYSEFKPVPTMGNVVSLEGKELRFGVVNSLIWSTATTVASNGSVNAMHSSLSPIAGGVAMFNIMLGEIIFGGVGCGMYGMLLFVLMTVFLAGLMVGRTPEYFGKKIEAKEIKMVILAIIAPCAIILIGTGIACVLPIGLSSLANRGPHGLSEIMYAFTSAAGNNGSAFAGLNANTNFYNLALAFTMLVGRFAIKIPVLAIAGSLVTKKVAPASVGTFSTDNFIFALLLVGVILIVGALTFLPGLSLGPIIEQFLMNSGRVF